MLAPVAFYKPGKFDPRTDPPTDKAVGGVGGGLGDGHKAPYLTQGLGILLDSKSILA